ncbi:MAG: PQQ-like beta-propeller repeat protein [Phycisphaerales bacterium]|nr:PQQ-like beta-propeller repeat protein [Phycisphaerales bacterium]
MNGSITNLLRLLCLGMTAIAAGQDNPVYIDESHGARQVLEQADAAAASNPAESVRLLQELLASSGHQLVATIESPNPTQFRSVREIVNQHYRSNPILLETMRRQYDEPAQRLLEAGMLQDVVQLHALTRPGLEAQLRLGRTDIELGALQQGVRRLELVLEHPDVEPASRAAALYGLGVASRLLGDLPMQIQVDADLEALPVEGAAFRDALASMKVTEGAFRNHTVMRTGPEASIEDLVVQSIWSVPLEHSLLNQRMDHPSTINNLTRGELEIQSEGGWYSTVVPTVRDNLVFINLGEVVIAMDALTGHPVWASHQQQPELRLDPTERPSGVNLIELEGRYLVTATGHLYATERSGDGLLLCFDAPTGQLRWGVQVNGHRDIDQSEGLFICSPPTIHEGTVYVQARKISPQQLVSEVLVAIDLVEGDILWSSWISSAGRLRRSMTPNTTAPLAIGSRIFVVTATGAIAAIDSTNGDLLWLHRLPTPKATNTPSGAIRPYTHLQPVMAGGSLICITPDGTEVLAIDPETGVVLQSISATQPERWNHPVYMLSSGDRIVSVGRDVRCFDVDQLETPHWILETADQIASPVPVGRVQLLEDSLIIPVRDQVLQVDLESGRILRSLTVEHDGNPLVAGPQLLVASSTHLDAYTAFDRARGVLEERIATRPDMVSLRLDLVRLAARSNQSELLHQSTRDLLNLLPTVDEQASESARDQLMRYLVNAIKAQPGIDGEHGAALRDLLVETADRPHRELEALLVLGDWIRASDPEEAAGLWRRILTRESLSRAWYEQDTLHAPGADWARRRLATIDVEPDPLDSVAWSDPVDSGDIEHVLGSARDNLRTNQDPVKLAAMFPETIHRLVNADRMDAAIGLLHSWDTRFPGELLLDETTLRSARKWADSLPPMTEPAIEEIPAADGIIEPPSRISGTLLPLAQGSVIKPPPMSPLLMRRDSIGKFDTRTMEQAWTARTTGLNNVLLQQDEQRIAILVEHGDFRPDLIFLDAGTGEELAPPIDLASLFKGMEPADFGHQSILPDGRMIELDELLICSNPEFIALVRRDGQLIGLGGDEGSEIQWQQKLPLRVVHGILPWPDGFVVIGPDPDVDQPLAVSNADPLLFHVDHRTGTSRRLQWPDAIGRFNWITRSPLNDLVLGGEEGIACITWPDHTPRWITTDPLSKQTRQGWASSEAVLVMDDKEVLHLLDIETGEDSGDLELPEYRDMAMIRELQADGRGFRILRETGVAIHDPVGTLVGTDGIPREYQFEHLLSDGGLHVLLAHRQTVTGLAGSSRAGGRRHLYRISILDDSGRVLDLLDLFPLTSRIRAARLHGRTLIIETDEAVDIITLPPVDTR